ncbi:TM2 domain-containing protein [Ferrimonas sp. SCSIO 43195]|uniref:TM2 domain-containing protein n=1 Tax=Ferrimonas sp. SCSIO 43195 TaxID=2822844 RepID=UPI00207596A3|nr:TM2 domain-containing protein [Ferrimonas sp. SCSIO 43195]USD38886.1 TM2 domain-containing protein [Ferrimonas sp. SCSIO 43195]
MTQQSEQLRQQEEQLRQEIRTLSDPQRQRYYAMERQLVKDPDTYAALNWCFVAGLHHFYLRRLGRGMFNLAMMLLGLLLLLVLPQPWGLGLIALVLLLELPQLFNAQNVVHQYNNQVMAHCLRQVRAHSD